MLANLPSYFRPRVPYKNPLTEQRARGLMLYLTLALMISIIAVFFLLWQTFLGNVAVDVSYLPVISSPLFVFLFYLAVRNGYYHASAYGIIGLTLASLVTFWDSSLVSSGIIAFAIPIVTSGLLLGWRTTILVFLATIALAAGPTLINNSDPGSFILMALVLSIVNALVITFGTNVQISAIRLVEELDKLQTVVNIMLTTSDVVNEQRAAVNTINLLRDKLGYTFVRVYMVEDKEVIERIQTGLNLTQVNIDTDFQLGSRSGIYAAVNSKDAVIISENDDSQVRQHLLSGTRAALAIPVMDKQNNVIAVLDIQSEDLSTFEASEINTIQVLASQFGQTVERLREFNTLRHDIIEQNELIARQRERLIQYERAERQTTTDSWREYLEAQGVEYLGYDIANSNLAPVEATSMSDEIQTAIQTGDISVRQEGDQQIVTVPISLRGQNLGAMSFRIPIGSQVVGARQQELIRNVVQRLSLALENKRLFEQSQSQAKRERKANEVGNLLLSTTDVNTVLQLAVENFNEALGAIQTQIRLKPEAREVGEGEVNS